MLVLWSFISYVVCLSCVSAAGNISLGESFFEKRRKGMSYCFNFSITACKYKFFYHFIILYYSFCSLILNFIMLPENIFVGKASTKKGLWDRGWNTCGFFP